VTGPPDLRGGIVAGIEWHEVAGSTNALAAAAAARGVPEVHLVLAGVQTAGRGRHGRTWTAPPGGSLLLSMVTRPGVVSADLPLLPLLTGLALAEAVADLLPGADVGLKWPNDLLLGGRKVAGILVEAVPGAAVVGVGVNVDWGSLGPAPPATSLAAAAGDRPVPDRWAVLAALLDRFAGRYPAWRAAPRDFLPAYRARSATVGRDVRVSAGGRAVTGTAAGVGPDGSLVVQPAGGPPVHLVAGDVEHVRPA
jgi:BirA family biotin operon repressor/biotin-[acetyl-CoA-carboxylase] ligase